MNLPPEEWILDSDILYLNHAAVGPWPKRTSEAVTRFAQENARHGSRDYLKWMQVETALKQKIAQLINAHHADEIALLKNTSEGLSIIAYGLQWVSGDNVVISNEEFPSNRIVWESLANQGVSVREANIQAAANAEDALLAACDQHTRVLAISSVQYASGFKINLEKLGEACQQRGIIFVVDAIQSVGVVEFDAQACYADAVVADGHKWMLGPEGVALFYCSNKLKNQLSLTQFGWHMVENVGDYDQRSWQPAKSARRFECGSPNMLGIHALDASLSLLLEVGMNKVASEVADKVAYLEEVLGKSPTLVLNRLPSSRRAGIVTFKHNAASVDDVYQYLMSRGVMCALRGGSIRYSPHYYTLDEQLDRAVANAETFSG